MAATLVEELVEEILMRIPPDEPAHLVSAALVCMSWRRILSDDGFLRRYRKFQGTPPLLGYIKNYHVDGGSRFVPTSNASPVSTTALALSWWEALDCRHGRVLIYVPGDPMEEEKLLVWNPTTGGQQCLSVPPYQNWFTGSVLCAVNGCDHLGCSSGPFNVVFLSTWKKEVHNNMVARGSIYSSETGVWSAPTSIDINLHCINIAPSLLIGDALYVTITVYAGLGILKYDICKHVLSVVDVPRVGWTDLIMEAEDQERLGLVSISGNCIYMWSQQDVTNGSHGWVKDKVMELQMLPADRESYTLKVVGFAEGTNIIFVGTSAAIFAVDLKTSKVRKLYAGETNFIDNILPYMSFYNPT